MRCEICGGQIKGKPRRAYVEGATLIVCEECARHSVQVLPAEERVRQHVGLPLPRERRPTPRRRLPAPLEDAEEYMVVEGFGRLIKQVRERRGWTQEELASKIGEKASLVGKLETEKVYPSFQLVRKLEHVLGVKLLARISEGQVKAYMESQPQGKETPTLGDVAVFKEGKRQA